MSVSQVSRQYAKALFSIIPPEELQRYAEEFAQAATVLGDPVVGKAFFHPRTPLSRKQEMARAMQLSPLLERFVMLTIVKSRDRYLPTMQKEFQALVNEQQNTTTAEVISAVPLTDDTIGKITERLHNLTGKTILTETKVDPKIGGGLIIRIDGQVIDGSIRGSLHKMKQALFAI